MNYALKEKEKSSNHTPTKKIYEILELYFFLFNFGVKWEKKYYLFIHSNKAFKFVPQLPSKVNNKVHTNLIPHVNKYMCNLFLSRFCFADFF